MTRRVASHLRIRLRCIEAKIGNLKAKIKAMDESIQIAKDDLFAYKVESTALQHALREWENDSKT